MVCLQVFVVLGLLLTVLIVAAANSHQRLERQMQDLHRQLVRSTNSGQAWQMANRSTISASVRNALLSPPVANPRKSAHERDCTPQIRVGWTASNRVFGPFGGLSGGNLGSSLIRDA
jgi:hypothetical protein